MAIAKTMTKKTLDEAIDVLHALEKLEIKGWSCAKKQIEWGYGKGNADVYEITYQVSADEKGEV